MTVEHTFTVPGSEPVVVTFDPDRQWVEAVKIRGVDMMQPQGCPLLWLRFSPGQLPGIRWALEYVDGPPAAWWFELPQVAVVPTLTDPWVQLVAGFERLKERAGQ